MSTLDTDLPVPADEPDDVALELEALALRRRRKMPRVTLALAVAIVGGGAFIGGAEAQKHLGSSASSSSNNSAAGNLAARLGKGNQATLGGGGGTAGTVTAIKGSTLYVTDASGNTVKVKTSAASQVTKTVTGKVADIKPGDTIVVRGSKGRNGVIAADSISLGGAGAISFAGGPTGANGGATGFGGSKGGG